MKKINEPFKCINCGKNVEPADKTCRNHCPYCFASLHVDDKLPGDRLSECNGKMLPFEYHVANGELKIHFKCTKCLKIHKNKKSNDDNLSELDLLISQYKRLFATI